ncbi:MAG: riboflavin synthase [Planctomycetota bacterium]
MFTGLVQYVGTIDAIEDSPAGKRWWVAIGDWWPCGDRGVLAGDSICVSGVCLTVAAIEGVAGRRRLAFDVIAETLAKSGLGARGVGGTVNLEAAVTADQPMGGHFMQGHVDGVGEVVAVQDDPADWRVGVKVPAGFEGWLVPKGSIAVDGVSLTLAEVDGDRFEVALIPTTLQHTTLDTLKAGDRVNLEGDVVVKSVVATLTRIAGQHSVTGIDTAKLRAAGFMK